MLAVQISSEQSFYITKQRTNHVQMSGTFAQLEPSISSWGQWHYRNTSQHKPRAKVFIFVLCNTSYPSSPNTKGLSASVVWTSNSNDIGELVVLGTSRVWISFRPGHQHQVYFCIHKYVAGKQTIALKWNAKVCPNHKAHQEGRCIMFFPFNY